MDRRADHRLAALAAVTGTIVAGGVVGAATGASRAPEGPTWGMEGPVFLEIYLVAIGLAVAAALAVRRWAWWWSERRAPDTPEDLPTEPVEVAYLTGGPRHAVLVAHLDLHERGLITVPEDAAGGSDLTRAELVEIAYSRPARGRQGPAQDAPGDLHPVVRRVLAAFARGEDHLPIVAEVRDSAEMAEVRRRLEARGWLVDAPLSRRLRAAAAPLALVVALGSARLAAGVENERPVLWLLLILGIAAVLTVTALTRVPFLTRRGRAAVASLPASRDAGDPAVASVGTLAVARRGPSAAWAVAPALAASFGFMPPVRGRSDATGAAAAGWTCGAGGCGGGGCGGGGCGGGCGG